MSGFNDEQSEFDRGGSDPVLEQRVERLEDDVRDIKADISTIKDTLADIRERLGTIEGRLQEMPRASAMWGMVVSTWIAGAGIVMLAVRLIQN